MRSTEGLQGSELDAKDLTQRVCETFEPATGHPRFLANMRHFFVHVEAVLSTEHVVYLRVHHSDAAATPQSVGMSASEMGQEGQNGLPSAPEILRNRGQMSQALA